MDINMDLDFLIKNNLTTEEYLLLELISTKKYGYLKKYIESFPHNKDTINILVKKGYLYDTRDEDELEVTKLMIRPDYKSLVKQSDYFDEFYETFPVKIIRPDGVYDYLRFNNRECRELYSQIIGGKKHMHEKIMDLLKYEVLYRENFNKMAYMKKMTNWLKTEAWKETEERVKDQPFSNNKIDTLAYGQELI